MKKFTVYILSVLILTLFAAESKAQNPLGKDSTGIVLKSISDNYGDWRTAETSGKLKSSLLPVSPTIKLFMQKGEILRMSVRAPLIGEVGRVEIDKDSITLINKMKKVYSKESLDGIRALYPGGLTDIQNFLLGRIVIWGKGEISDSLKNEVEVYRNTEGGYLLVPDADIQPNEFSYGYLTYPDGKTATMMLTDADNMNLIVNYNYGINFVLDLQMIVDNRQYDGTIELDNYKFDTTSGFKALVPDKKYKRVNLKQFMRSF